MEELAAAKVRIIAFYLPQFHPCRENDEWWGKGFTEWTNVARAKPLFPGHYQPHVPADLGFYDLRVPETRMAQAEMAQAYGIEGFCYWHYWFAGKQLLERPFNEVLKSREPDFPFCLGWANESWSGIWHGAPDRILMAQTYPGLEDHEKHFYALLEAFGDDRYITVDGKPLFVVYKPRRLPDSKRVTDCWRELASKAGLAGLYLVAVLQSEAIWSPEAYGYDAITVSNQGKVMDAPQQKTKRRFGAMSKVVAIGERRPEHVYEYEDALPYFLEDVPPNIRYHPCIVPNWDNTPRSGVRGLVLHGSTPELFGIQVRAAMERAAHLRGEESIIFVKSWNEWAEGNHLEPDLRYGRAYLQVLLAETLARKPKLDTSLHNKIVG
jgi:lipopolysaccharide biosynthesis protein